MFLASFVEKSYLTLKYLAAILFLPKKNSAQFYLKWHPGDFCWGHPIVSESIIKHRPYREKRFGQNPLDYVDQMAVDWLSNFHSASLPALRVCMYVEQSLSTIRGLRHRISPPSPHFNYIIPGRKCRHVMPEFDTHIFL